MAVGMTDGVIPSSGHPKNTYRASHIISKAFNSYSWSGNSRKLSSPFFGWNLWKNKPIDKSQIYIRFNPIYLVFCIVYHLFWIFWCVFLSCRWCSSRKIEEQAKSSKKESKEAKMGKVQEHATAWFCHAAAWDDPIKNPRLACRGMPNSCRDMAVLMWKTLFFIIFGK